MAKIHILVGSVMGTAEGVAAAMDAELRALGHSSRVNFSPEVADLLGDAEEILLVCTSNTGSGDLPDNIQPLYLALTRDYPAIAGRRYGMVNLGDSSYVSFNEGGRALDAAFEDLGARRLGEPLVLDASEGEDPEELARTWVKSWAEAHLGAA
jgi:MioC protein